MDDNFWNRAQGANLILYGVLGEERPDQPGVYRFRATTGHNPDVQILSPDVDVDDTGEVTKPRPGSLCIVVTTANGADAYVIGFIRPPKFNEDEDEDPVVGNPADNSSSGDKVYKTAGGASFILKRGGSVLIEGGAGTGVILNPLNNQMSLRCSNFKHIVDGYSTVRGRSEPGGTSEKTSHRTDYLHQVGPTYDRVRITHGDLDGDARRQFTLSAVTVVASQSSVTVKTRETYYSDGSWVGEGPKYQWGGPGADEPFVLGNALVTAMNKLMDIIAALKVNTAWGPSTPPIPPTPVDLNTLKNELGGKILSTFLFSSQDPADLG